MNLQLIADFDIRMLANCLASTSSDYELSTTIAPYGQVVPSLARAGDGTKHDFALVWTSPERTIAVFRDAMRGANITEDKVFAEVDEFVGFVKTAQNTFRAIFVASWTLPVVNRGNGLLSLRNQGVRKLLMKMNLRLADAFESGSVYLLDAQRWIEAVGRSAYNPKLWYLSKCPFTTEVFQEAARDIKAAITTVLGGNHKLVIVDLDNTLWGGVVGDVGWEHLRLGGHDHVGEALVDFQLALQTLRRRGVLLGIVSKNQEHIALEALSKHPEMVLRVEDFSGWRINWQDKAANIADLAAELNVGLRSVVFLDDNPVERDRVRQALPEVCVPDWPSDKVLFASRLLELACFDTAQVTPEDQSRTNMYAAEKQRTNLKKTASSLEDWLVSLRTELTVEGLSNDNRARVVQLLNKTNQMNLANRRMSEQELVNWCATQERTIWAFRTRDRFGDSGLTGALSLDISKARAHIVDFVLSCRVLGRQIEFAMIAVAVQYCRALGVKELVATYAATALNQPCLEFWTSSGFRYDRQNRSFIWSLDIPYRAPNTIRVISRLPEMQPTEHSHLVSSVGP